MENLEEQKNIKKDAAPPSPKAPAFDKSSADRSEDEANWSAFSLALSLGYTIAIPIIVLALGGRFLDREFGTSPLFLLTGVVVSILLSTFGIYFKVKKIIK